jgi:hypothetical protein
MGLKTIAIDFLVLFFLGLEMTSFVSCFQFQLKPHGYRCFYEELYIANVIIVKSKIRL